MWWDSGGCSGEGTRKQGQATGLPFLFLHMASSPFLPFCRLPGFWLDG